MVPGCLEAIEDQFARRRWRAVFKAGILVESADEKEAVRALRSIPGI